MQISPVFPDLNLYMSGSDFDNVLCVTEKPVSSKRWIKFLKDGEEEMLPQLYSSNGNMIGNIILVRNEGGRVVEVESYTQEEYKTILKEKLRKSN